MHAENRMNPAELRASLALSTVFFLRMFGLFLILPVFVLYAETLPDSTPLLAGIALGCYGLTQALFQIPFGMASDKLGRKKVIICGLLLFGIGSITAGTTDSIYIIILGRILQGAGAIAAAIMALTADLTRETQRSKAMALIGAAIGFAFMLSFVAGPVLNPFIGVPGLFYLSAGLSVVAILIVVYAVPDPDNPVQGLSRRYTITDILKNRQLYVFYTGIFLLHMILMANFVAVPLVLRNQAAIDAAHHWQIYLPVLLLSGLIMVPFLLLGERLKLASVFFRGAIAIMVVAQFGLINWNDTIAGIAITLTLFFLAFNYLEATLPSLISQAAPPEQKGAALGIYSTSQFIGTFIGGVFGGYLFQFHGIDTVFLGCLIISVLWFTGLLLTKI